jgi:hypothetical protein
MHLVRRTVALVAAVVVSVPLVVAPVAAASALLPAWACGPGAAGQGHWEASEPVAAGRGTGQFREPKLDQASKDLPARAKGRAPADFTATVDVYFHVITNGAQGNLTAQHINAQIAVLNTTFGGGEGGAETGFSFQLAGVTRTNNAKWFAAKSEATMKKALKLGNDSDLNVYSNTAGAYLGWAYYPSITDTRQAYLDGIVLDWETVPGASDRYEGAYDLGETLTHEAGHWLDLAHTFENGCREPGDFVEDTPPQASPTSGCPEGRDSCPAPGLDPIHNYMDYSYDSCYTEFTAGQTQRMRDAWLVYRAS